MDTLRVNIDRENNRITVYNNGKGIPVQMHQKEQVYVPELIFGHLLTSSNYDDDEKKVTGGRNGYGAKLCNIFSSEFIVETADKVGGKKFKQVREALMVFRVRYRCAQPTSLKIVLDL
jgi:DNA topoisomerase-2